jgi:hypothetical protein
MYSDEPDAETSHDHRSLISAIASACVSQIRNCSLRELISNRRLLSPSYITHVLSMHGITLDVVADLAEIGLATLERESVAGDAAVRITEAGRRALDQRGQSDPKAP